VLTSIIHIPEIPRLKQICQSLAMLDAILMPDWGLRYFSFNNRWAPAEQMASMRNGSGDTYHILFNQQGAIIKGFVHDSPMGRFVTETGKVWSGILDQLPDEFNAGFLDEPAFVIDETSFCVWRQYGEKQWNIGDITYQAGKDPDGSAYLLAFLEDDPIRYRDWAVSYYEIEIPLDAVKSLFRHIPLTDSLIFKINPNRPLDDLREDLAEIEYPLSQ